MSKESAPPMENEHFQQVLYFFLMWSIYMYSIDLPDQNYLLLPPFIYQNTIDLIDQISKFSFMN